MFHVDRVILQVGQLLHHSLGKHSASAYYPPGTVAVEKGLTAPE